MSANRDARNLMIALGVFLSAIIVVGVVGGYFVHRHFASINALHHDPSYRYGKEVDVTTHRFSHAREPAPVCSKVLTAHPPIAFASFSLQKGPVPNIEP